MAHTSREFWQKNAHKSPNDIVIELGLADTRNFYRDRRVSMEKYPEFPWYKKTGATNEGAKATGESYEILDNGKHVSTKLLQMDAAQAKKPEFLLHAHGFDLNAWELVSAKNNIWNVASDENGIQTLYSSRISVRPLSDTQNWGLLMKAAGEVEPCLVNRPTHDGSGGLLELDLFDMHWGWMGLSDYQTTLDGCIALIESRDWDTVLIPVGSDLFHTDNLRGTTSNGTHVGDINWPGAWGDAGAFFGALIEAALARGLKVVLIYVKGNHCESMSWGFCQFLMARYPQATVDASICERKVFRWWDVAIGLTHGDKAMKDIDRVFAAEFPEFRDAVVKEIHGGHVHHEVAKDMYGTMVRRNPTANKPDGWHADSGFVGACKRFLAYRYTHEALQGTDYV